MPPNKLVMGIPTYGRSFRLQAGFESCPLTNTPVSGPSAAGEFSREQGFLSKLSIVLVSIKGLILFLWFTHMMILAYYEVCRRIRESDWRYIWNDKQKVPYAYTNEAMIRDGESMEWVGFDDVKSVEIKVKYAMANKLAGAMLWALDMVKNYKYFPLDCLFNIDFYILLSTKRTISMGTFATKESILSCPQSIIT